MPAFVSCTSGTSFINLDRVARTEAHNQRGTVSNLFAESGELLGRVYTSNIPEGEVIPAAAGLFAVVITVFADGSVSHQRHPIAAWRVLRGTLGESAFPIISDDLCSNETILVELPDGRLCLPAEQVFDNLESAKDCLLKRAQTED